MNLSNEQKERLKQIVQETSQLQADIVAMGGTPLEPVKAVKVLGSSPRGGAGEAGGSAGGEAVPMATESGEGAGAEEVKPEATGRGRRKSKGRKR